MVTNRKSFWLESCPPARGCWWRLSRLGGLDIAATDYVLRQLSVARDAGTAVLLISSDLDQLLSVADRVLVFFRGSVVADLDAAVATREEIGRYMSGIDLVAAGRASLLREPGDAEPADDPGAGPSDSPAKSNGA